MNAMYAVSITAPIGRAHRAPSQIVAVIEAEDPTMTTSSAMVSLSWFELWPVARSKMPIHRVSRKMLPPTVFATTIPEWPRLLLTAETKFSGIVVAIESTTIPDNPSEKPNSVVKIAAVEERT